MCHGRGGESANRHAGGGGRWCRWALAAGGGGLLTVERATYEDGQIRPDSSYVYAGDYGGTI